MKYEKQFRKDNPKTIGESDHTFDLSNYKDWLDKQHSQLLKQNNDMREQLKSLFDLLEEHQPNWYTRGHYLPAKALIESTNP